MSFVSSVCNSNGKPCIIVSKPRIPAASRVRSRFIAGTAILGLRRYYLNARGLWRIFNSACFRFYRSNSAPPETTDSPYDTNATLPHTPTDTFADGTWYLSMSWFNGVLNSGFLPVGPGDETYIKLVISGGEVQTEPPSVPEEWHLSQLAGVVTITAVYNDPDSRKADEWAVAYTTNGSTPAGGAPSITADISEFGPGVLVYALPVQVHDVVVKVCLQVRRNDGTESVPVWTYSTSDVKSITVDTDGPTAPQDAEVWPGLLGIAH